LELDSRLIRFIEGGKKMKPPKSMISNFRNENKLSSSVEEGDKVNTHITAAPALIALALIYLKTNNKTIVDHILIPNSFCALEQCNPNTILMKTITKNLIMWDNIKNTEEFIWK
jgi:anaphase-promoting complex subunit 1